MSLLTRRSVSEVYQAHWATFLLLFLGLVVVVSGRTRLPWALVTNRAYILVSQGEAKYANQAYALFNSAASQGKQAGDSVAYGLGLAALQLDELDAAGKAAQWLGEESSRRAMLAYLLGYHYFDVGPVDRAVEEWHHVPGIGGLLVPQAGRLEASGQIDRAEQLLLAAEKSDPQAYEIYAKLGEFYLRQDDSESASNAYRCGSERVGGAGRAYLAGLAYELEHDWKAALEAHRAAIGLNAPEVYLRLGDLLCYSFKRLEEALPFYLQGLALEPQNPRWHQRIARVYADQGNLIEAERWFLETLRWYPDPGNWWVRSNLARVYLKMGKLSEARGQFETSLALHDENPGAHRGLALLHMQAREWDSAVVEYRIAIEQADPYDVARFRHELAVLYEQIGQVENAIGEYRALLESNPKDAVARERLSILGGKEP